MNIFIILPFIIGLIFFVVCMSKAYAEHKNTFDFTGKTEDAKSRGKLHIAVATLLLLGGLSVAMAIKEGKELQLFALVDNVPISFRVDRISVLFAVVTGIIWILIGIYSFKYMSEEVNEKRFYAFYVLAYGVLVGLDFSANLITFYMFYELMSLCTMPLVFHSGTKESIMAAYKYLFYSLTGAYMALFGIYVLYQNTGSMDFVAGGSLISGAADKPIVLVAVFLILLGFGTKAGMLPLHAWLTAAHPVAPSPASAALSSLIVKSGVLAVIRVLFFITGTDVIKGTWVQKVWMSLTLLTVFMGSMLAYREKVFKKRLAYSTVSQVSYILFGLSTLNDQAIMGSLFHFVAHAFIKCGLFLTAGIFIYRTGKTRVDEFKGIGKRMPLTLWCYTICSMGLIGIPLTGGFISKYYLAVGALKSEDIGIFSYLGPIVLIVSALLTAGYLLPITLKGFLPGEEGEEVEKDKLDSMSVVLLIMAIVTVVIGVLPNQIISQIVSCGL